MTTHQTVFSKDIQHRMLTVTRAFDASLQQVWAAWTQSEILEQWWAPDPYRIETKTMDFTPGGRWHYCMISPEDERNWCMEQYSSIETLRKIANSVSFCDEAGNLNTEFPTMYWTKEFSETAGATSVRIEITFDTEADMEKVIAAGFREGFTAGLSNLDRYLKGL